MNTITLERLAEIIKANFAKLERASEAVGEEFSSGYFDATAEIAQVIASDLDDAGIDSEAFLKQCRFEN